MIYHMSDWREAGNAAFHGPRILIGPFVTNRFGRLVQGQVNDVSDIKFPDTLHLEIVRSALGGGMIKDLDSRQALARSGVHVATPPLGPREVGEAGAIGAAPISNSIGSDGGSVTRFPFKPGEDLAALTVEVGG
jgi:hypothetical protein